MWNRFQAGRYIFPPYPSLPDFGLRGVRHLSFLVRPYLHRRPPFRPRSVLLLLCGYNPPPSLQNRSALLLLCEYNPPLPFKTGQHCCFCVGIIHPLPFKIGQHCYFCAGIIHPLPFKIGQHNKLPEFKKPAWYAFVFGLRKSIWFSGLEIYD